MTADTRRKKNEWIWLPGDQPGGRYVSAGRMRKDGSLYHVCDTIGMREYDFDVIRRERMKEIIDSYLLMEKFVKYVARQANNRGDGSHIPTNKEQIEMIFYALGWMLSEPYKSLLDTVMNGPLDVVSDVLEVTGGPCKNKYDVLLLRYDENGNLNPVRKMKLPKSGVITALDDDSYLPIETRLLKTDGQATMFADNERPEDFPIEHPGCFRGKGVTGYLEFSCDPVVGQQYLVRHATNMTYPINIHLLNMNHIPFETSAFLIRPGNR